MGSALWILMPLVGVFMALVGPSWAAPMKDGVIQQEDQNISQADKQGVVAELENVRKTPSESQTAEAAWFDRNLVGYDPIALEIIKELIEGVQSAVEENGQQKDMDLQSGNLAQVDKNVPTSATSSSSTTSNTLEDVKPEGSGNEEELTQFNTDHTRLDAGGHGVKVGFDKSGSVSSDVQPIIWHHGAVKRHPSLSFKHYGLMLRPDMRNNANKNKQ